MPLAAKYEIPLDTFRRLNPCLMERYLPYFAECIKQRRREQSEVGWVNGAYVGRAISGCFPKGKKYPDEPLQMWSEDAGNESQDSYTDADRFAAFAAVFNQQHKELQEYND